MSQQESPFEELERLAQADEQDAVKDRAPKRAGKREPAKPSAPRAAPLERRLAQFFTATAVVVSAFDPTCGLVVQERSALLASAWARLAQQDKRVGRMLEALLSGGAYGEAFFVTAITLLPILRHHGLLPANVQEAAELITIESAATPEEVLA